MTVRRVLQVDKFLHPQGGAPAYMFGLAELQRAAGLDVEFFSMADERNVPARYSDSFAPHLQLSPFPRGLGERSRTLSAMIWSRPARRAIEQVLDDFRPDVVHVHNVYHQLSPSILWAARAAGVPVVMTVHDAKLVCASYNLFDGHAACDVCVGHRTFASAVRRRCRDGSLAASAALAVESTIHRWARAYRPVGAFICPSTFILGELRRAGVFPDRLVHIPNFADIGGISPADDAGDGVVYVGRLNTAKGVDVLVDAVGRTPGTRLDCYGDGPARAHLEQLADRVAPGRVTFHGAVSREEVFAAHRRGRVSVLPSRSPENLPLSILEAMACARPVIATTLGGSPELVDDGITGRLVPPDDPDALAAAIVDLTADARRARTAGVAARAATLRYAPEPHLEAVSAVYDQVLFGRSRR